MNSAELIERIHDLQGEYGMTIQSPCPPAQIEHLRRRVREELDCALPDAYEEFLSLSNGLDWNGMVLYSAGHIPGADHEKLAIQDLVTANLALRDTEGFANKLVLGESGMELYIHYLGEDRATIIDSISLDEYESFPSMRELIASVLRRKLDIGS